MRYFVGLVAALALVAGATKLGYDRFESEIETRSGVTVPTGTTLPSVLPSAGQVVVVGSIANLHVESALLEPLPMPLTITTAERGLSGSGTFTGVAVDGADASIHWDAGTPLKLDGKGGSLAVGAVTFDADGTESTVSFGELPQGITPGTYTIGSPVAVGIGSALAQPRDSVTFTAAQSATVTFTGGAVTTFPNRAMTIKGPGKVVLTGKLTVVNPDRTQADFSRVSLDSGPFTLVLTAGKDGLTVQATLQGAVTTG